MATKKQFDLLGLSLQELTTALEPLGQPPYRARQLFHALYRQRLHSLQDLTTFPIALRRTLQDEGWTIAWPSVEKRFVSTDGTVRYLMGFPDGQSVETVWMPEGDGAEDVEESSGETEARVSQRGTICISSQAGCAVGCEFCMTAQLGLLRNLTSGEIAGQVLAVLEDQGVEIERDRINLVFMGQGEPFLNFEHFARAVEVLAEGAGIPVSRMTVSTAGIEPRIEDFSRLRLRPRLAISLNASNDPLRRQLMPITRKWSLDRLMDAARNYPLRDRERLTFEYVLLGGVNDSESHAHEVIALLRGIRAKINLIAWNPGPGIPFGTPEPERVLAFQSVLVRAGIPTFIRRPRGRDIYAACGQLKRTTELVSL